MKHRFVLRPRIASRFTELDARYRSKMNGVRQRLEQMISTNAPAAEFENALRDFPEKPIPLQRPTSAFSSGQMPGGVPSYRDLIARRPPMRAFTGAAYTAFANWLGFKLAEESGNEEKLKIAARELEKIRSEFAPEVAKIVSERLSKVRPVVREHTRNLYQLENSTGDPENDLIANLAARENLETLAEAWRKVADEDATPLPESETLSPANWASIARAPENLGLINLRELAARQALASITQSPASDKVTEPIATQLIEALEKAFASGSKAQARRLLRLDIASSSLSYNEHVALRQIAELLPDPADPSLKQDKSMVEKRYRALLAQAASPAAARFASEQLKKVQR
jgi:hypothetical protein